jgi:hypothetical protein
MNHNLTMTEQDMRLAAVYHQMNGKGRDVLDMATQKLAEVQWRVEKASKRKKRKMYGEQ